MNRTKLSLFALALSCMALASSQDSYTLLKVAKEGDTRKYRVTADLTVMGTAVTFSAIVNEKVTKVEEDGAYTYQSTQSDVKIKLGDTEMGGDQAAVTTTTRVRPTGEVLEVAGDMVDRDSLRRGFLSLIVVPKEPVKVGHKWSHEVKADKVNGETPGKGEYEVVGVEKVGDADAVVVSFKYTETTGAEPASGEGKVWVSPKGGHMLKLEAMFKNTPIEEAGGLVDMKVSIVLAD